VITGIVLAAGASSRLGRPKQLLGLGGKPVLQHVIDAAVTAPLDEVVVVLGHEAKEIAAAVRAKGVVRFAINPGYAEGQSNSLRVGLEAADARSGAALVLLGDQPGIRPDAIAAVVGAWKEGGKMMIQAAYGGRAAHPTLFDRSVWTELEGMSGDEGARSLLANRPEWRVTVEVGGQPPDDIDTEEDYQRVRAAFETH
jgi:molybdenum cofactor cytidylyltransferase